ncbi:MAG: hypothetical protein LBG48_01695 [Rickettsiales bacterium]|nr:hypothetical protein [Rickettsiales bacterium]
MELIKRIPHYQDEVIKGKKYFDQQRQIPQFASMISQTTSVNSQITRPSYQPSSMISHFTPVNYKSASMVHPILNYQSASANSQFNPANYKSASFQETPMSSKLVSLFSSQPSVFSQPSSSSSYSLNDTKSKTRLPPIPDEFIEAEFNSDLARAIEASKKEIYKHNRFDHEKIIIPPILLKRKREIDTDYEKAIEESKKEYERYIEDQAYKEAIQRSIEDSK